MDFEKDYIPDQENGKGRSPNISRRGFLRLAGVTAGAFAARPLYEYSKLINGLLKPVEGEESLTLINESLKLLKNRYGLEVYNGESKLSALTRITGEKMSTNELRVALGVAMAGCIKYPPDFFRNNSIYSFRLTDKLKRRGNDIMGVANPISFSMDFLPEVSVEENEDTFHHELCHVLNARPSASSYKNQWNKVHTRGFVFGDLSQEEDRAYLMASMMIPARHKNLIDQMNREVDAGVADEFKEKYNLVKKRLLDTSKGLMNEEYWTNLLNERLDINYFTKT